MHGYGKSGKSWGTTPDGRDGFQNIFLEHGYKTFIVDQPRRGKAGQSTETYNFSAKSDDQLWYYNFRIGEYPKIYDGVKFPHDEESVNKFLHQMTPSFEKSGEGILITHSAGGGLGCETAIKSEKFKAIISLEPGTFPFPENELPEIEETTSPFPAKGQSVSMEDFMKLTKIPIVIYFGDNIPNGDKPVKNLEFDNWRTRLNLVKKCRPAQKKYGIIFFAVNQMKNLRYVTRAEDFIMSEQCMTVLL